MLDRLRERSRRCPARELYGAQSRADIPKLWLEVQQSDPTLPVPAARPSAGARVPLPEVSWVGTYAQLTRRGQYRIEPLLLRARPPIGLFESYATVGQSLDRHRLPARVEPIPGGTSQPASVEGIRHAHPVRTPHKQRRTHTSISPRAGRRLQPHPLEGAARDRGELQVKEFDLEQTADVWLFLDLYGPSHTGEGDESTVEYAVRAAAAIGAQAIYDNRAVAMTASGARVVTLQPDRGQRQYQKVMQLLAAANADGSQPLSTRCLSRTSCACAAARRRWSSHRRPNANGSSHSARCSREAWQ